MSEIRNITTKHKNPTSIFLTSIKVLLDLWPLIPFTIYEEEPCKIEEKPCKCPSEEESIHFKEVCFRAYMLDKHNDEHHTLRLTNYE